MTTRKSVKVLPSSFLDAGCAVSKSNSIINKT